MARRCAVLFLVPSLALVLTPGLVQARSSVPDDPVADTLLRDRVETQLRQDADLARDTDIAVEVRDGAVLLTGSVRTLRQVWEARRRASEVPGVRGVRSALDIPHVRGDADVAFDIAARFRHNSDLLASGIRADVRDGIVSLSGAARDERVRLLAQEVAAAVDGVRGIEDRIEGPPTLDERLLSQLRIVLDSAGRNIEASVEDGIVSLSGEATSEEKEALVRKIHGIDGVRGVVDMVEVATR